MFAIMTGDATLSELPPQEGDTILNRTDTMGQRF